MLLALLVAPALATEVVIETAIPVRVALDDRVVARLLVPSTLSLPAVTPGPHVMIVDRAGVPERHDIDVPEDGRLRVIVSRGDLVVLAAPLPAAPDGVTTGSVELRISNGPAASVRLDGEPHALSADGPLRLADLPAGNHVLEVRSADRTSVWARGELEVRAGDELVLILSEGRAPECFGRPDAWHPQR
ncbi:MAG: hypothetical protein H6739_07090 [Alphaproteobacteria bacterium]|nr:hypothetical protein [Alphaproteobacteria bacterium]